MKTILTKEIYEITIKNSKFIGVIIPIESPEFCSCLYYQYALKPFSIRPFYVNIFTFLCCVI